MKKQTPHNPATWTLLLIAIILAAGIYWQSMVDMHLDNRHECSLVSKPYAGGGYTPGMSEINVIRSWKVKAGDSCIHKSKNTE